MKNRFIKLLLAAVLLGSLSPAAAQTREMDLSGEWRFQTDVMDFRRGSLSPRYNHQLQETIMLPGITDNTYAYYAPLLTTNRGLYLKLNSMKFYKKTRPWVKDTIPQTFINKNNCESPRRLKKIRKTVITFCKLTYHIPVINWLYNPGIITWLMFMAFFVFWTRKEYDSMITFIPLLLIFGICLLSPKNNNLRYIYPTCCMIPAMLAAAFGEKNPDL